MTPNEITTEIASQLKKELDDVFKLILFQKVGNWRARLIRNSLERKPQEAKFFFQTLWVPMEKKDLNPDCLSIPNMCPAAISKEQLPSPLRYNSTLFEFVGSADGSKTFSYGPSTISQYLKAGKYSKKSVHYDWVDNRIVLPDNPNIPMIKVTHIFDNPEAVMKFNCDQGVGCNWWDLDYPVPREMLQQIVQYIVQEYKGEPINTGKQIEVNPPQITEPDGR